MDFHFARLTAFLANVLRNEDKQPEPFSYKDFLVDWNALWEAIATEPDPELTVEEEQVRNENLLSKVVALNTWFGGTTA